MYFGENKYEIESAYFKTAEDYYASQKSFTTVSVCVSSEDDLEASRRKKKLMWDFENVFFFIRLTSVKFFSWAKRSTPTTRACF